MYLIKDICKRCKAVTQEIEIDTIPARGALTCLECPSSSSRLIVNLDNNEIVNNSEFVRDTIAPILREMGKALKEKEEQRKNFVYIPEISDDCHYNLHSLCRHIICPCKCHTKPKLCKRCGINPFDISLSLILDVDSWCSQCLETEKWNEIQALFTKKAEA